MVKKQASEFVPVEFLFIRLFWGLYIKHHIFVMYGLHHKQMCLFKSVEVTENSNRALGTKVQAPDNSK